MNVDDIRQGIVLDHITAGRSMEIYRYLELEKLDCSVAIIKNVRSTRMGKKDIIKIDELIRLRLELLGYIDPGITVNIIRDGIITEKKQLALPGELRGVLRCRNPRCITADEPALESVFVLSDPETSTYRCIYCETRAK
ncbi:MAG: aspartate carbamoyltransferase regulatory subunit [Christensenellales bacterium]|jgi:aspartate carbamoyltransferase regulatory subunit